MIDKTTRDALFKEIHKSIDEAAEFVVTQLHAAPLSYPPGVELTPDERAALSDLKLSSTARSGLRKLVADACSYPLFRFFSLLDGVADPGTKLDGIWSGATLADKTEGDETMLHDELFESCWLYRNEKKAAS